jgi:hypothetical protein
MILQAAVKLLLRETDTRSTYRDGSQVSEPHLSIV